MPKITEHERSAIADQVTREWPAIRGTLRKRIRSACASRGVMLRADELEEKLGEACAMFWRGVHGDDDHAPVDIPHAIWRAAADAARGRTMLPQTQQWRVMAELRREMAERGLLSRRDLIAAGLYVADHAAVVAERIDDENGQTEEMTGAEILALLS